MRVTKTRSGQLHRRGAMLALCGLIVHSRAAVDTDAARAKTHILATAGPSRRYRNGSCPCHRTDLNGNGIRVLPIPVPGLAA